MTDDPINSDRLAQIITLAAGSHEKFSEGVCAMEAVAYVAGEKFSDHPKCACPVIGAYMRAWNDALPQADRDRLLLPLIPRLVGSRSTKAVEDRRATMAADWLVRVHTPAWLRLAGLTEHAATLASLPEITDFAKTPALMPALTAARKDAAAARAAARDAAWAAAGAAAGDAEHVWQTERLRQYLAGEVDIDAIKRSVTP